MLFSLDRTVVIREHKLPREKGAFTLSLHSEYTVLQVAADTDGNPILLVQEEEESEAAEVHFELVESSQTFSVSPRSSDERNHIHSFRAGGKLLHLIGSSRNKGFNQLKADILRSGGAC
ncbi:MAG: hypothetical protein K2W82_11375 [Candidatus Obscuribacterales bacterium]|nr:hypothetical protein [Candidatus Obscuribacterales bacterium]